MKILKNPFLAEGLESTFSHPPILRSLFYSLIAIAGATFFWWPRGPLADALRTGQPPQTFMVTSITMLLCLIFVSGRSGLEDFAAPDSTRILDVVKLTPVRISSIVLGKLAVSVIHTVFFLFLVLPVLVATRAVSGRGFQELWAVAAAAGASALCYRSLGLLFYVTLEQRPTARRFGLLGVAIGLLLIPLAFFPASTPLLTMVDPRADVRIFGAAVPAYALSAIISLLAVGIFSAAAIVWLRFVRRRHSSRAVSPAPVKHRRFEE